MFKRSKRSAVLFLLIGLAGVCPSGAVRAQSIVAVVNGDVITDGDVNNKEKLFTLSTGLPATPEVLTRLQPQVMRQLIDEKLRMQEIETRHIAVADQDISTAIKEIERRNKLPEGGLRVKLAATGIAYRTLVDQIRVQIGWIRVMRQELGDSAQITESEISGQMQRLASETGKPEYQVAQIFIPSENSANMTEAHRFANTIAAQLRAGAAFSMVAAQFSQSKNALQGGDEGWVHVDQLDMAVASVIMQMPLGAISNPIQVPGGFSIVTLRGKRNTSNLAEPNKAALQERLLDEHIDQASRDLMRDLQRRASIRKP
jgi:peptidyl-prolyl cis-trans isomerase SurA